MRRSYRLDAPALTLRCDASASIGGGHLLRCLALAQEWQARGGDALFVTAAPAPLVRRVEAEQLRVVELPSAAAGMDVFLEHLEERGGWAALDGYHYDLADERRVRETAQLLVLDDYAHRPRYSADVLLNQNPTGPETAYVLEGDARLLLGTRYTLLRREFVQPPPPERRTERHAKRVLVTLGNGDFPDARARVLAGLVAAETPFEVRLVQGEAAGAPPPTPSVEVVAGGQAMRAHMEWCDFAVSAGGSTCWELAFLGVPTVALSLAENQRSLAAALARAGAGVDLGPAELLTPELVAPIVDVLAEDADRRRAMSEAGRRLVDGRGAARVVDVLRAGA
jgi:UDP-2,4-diacetamido-2,4,6-trideoxy-beta-L-altropyranose hydrolase